VRKTQAIAFKIKYFGHAMSGLPSKNHNWRTNGAENKRRTENDVIEQYDKGWLQQVERESGQRGERRHWTYEPES